MLVCHNVLCYKPLNVGFKAYESWVENGQIEGGNQSPEVNGWSVTLSRNPVELTPRRSTDKTLPSSLRFDGPYSMEFGCQIPMEFHGTLRTCYIMESFVDSLVKFEEWWKWSCLWAWSVVFMVKS